MLSQLSHGKALRVPAGNSRLGPEGLGSPSLCHRQPSSILAPDILIQLGNCIPRRVFPLGSSRMEPEPRSSRVGKHLPPVILAVPTASLPQQSSSGWNFPALVRVFPSCRTLRGCQSVPDSSRGTKSASTPRNELWAPPSPWSRLVTNVEKDENGAEFSSASGTLNQPLSQSPAPSRALSGSEWNRWENTTSLSLCPIHHGLEAKKPRGERTWSREKRDSQGDAASAQQRSHRFFPILTPAWLSHVGSPGDNKNEDI